MKRIKFDNKYNDWDASGQIWQTDTQSSNSNLYYIKSTKVINGGSYRQYVFDVMFQNMNGNNNT